MAGQWKERPSGPRVFEQTQDDIVLILEEGPRGTWLWRVVAMGVVASMQANGCAPSRPLAERAAAHAAKALLEISRGETGPRPQSDPQPSPLPDGTGDSPAGPVGPSGGEWRPPRP